MTTLEEPQAPASPSTSSPAQDTYPRLNQPDNSVAGVPLFIAIAVIVIVLIGSLFAVGVVALIRDEAPAGGAGTAAASTTVDVSLSEFAIDGALTVPAGDVVLNVANDGAIEHNVTMRGTGIASANLQSRGTDTMALGNLAPGTYELFCSIAGHESSGMVTDLVVTGDATADGEGAAHAESEVELTAAEMDQRMVDSMLAFPAETEGRGNEALEPTILADGTKQFELTAAVTKWEVSPGEFVDAWSYNGIVPGPQLSVDLGDKVEVVLHNETPMGTDIHWHGLHTPNNQDGVSPFTQDPVASGESFTYNFVADDPAIGMYHAHLHSQISVPNGMFGAFTIGENPLPRGQTISGVKIPDDLEVAVEMPMVLNDAGVIGLSLNGKSFPATEALVVEEGDWVAVHYYNEGLTDHPMHLHQFPAVIYAKDGIPLDQPYYADTVNVAPGERYSILFQAEDVGTWVWHCHILTHVEREEGMFGMVTAVVVTPKDA